MKSKDSELRAKLKAQKKFGDLVVKARKAKSITPAELARLCYFERSSMARIESGETNVTLLTMLRIAGALNIGLEDLLNGFDAKK